MKQEQIEQGRRDLEGQFQRLQQGAPRLLRDPRDHDYVITYPLHSVVKGAHRLAPGAADTWLDAPVEPGSALYVHIGFCRYMCRYCRHYKVDVIKERDDLMRLVDTILLELDLLLERLGDGAQEIISLRLGGGTPTILEPEQLDRLLGGIYSRLPLGRDVVGSTEAKPVTLTPEKLAVFRQHGFERISLGVQTLDAENYAFQHNKESLDVIYDALQMVHDAGFSSINADFISGLPSSTVEQWNESCEEMVRLAKEGVFSEISLQAYHDDPRTKNWTSAEQASTVDEWLQIWMVRRSLEEIGWQAVSNWLFLAGGHGATDYFTTLHEHGGSFLGYYYGLGNSAYTEQPGYLLLNEWDVEPYVDRVTNKKEFPFSAGLQLDPERRLAGELAKAAFHACPAIDPERLSAKYQIDVNERYGKRFDLVVDNGLAARGEDGVLRMTELGDFCNFEAAKLFFLEEDEAFRREFNRQRFEQGRKYRGY